MTTRRLLGERPTHGTEEDVPGHLFHYTSQQALLGILSRRELWCSQIQYASDRTEFRHAINLLRTLCHVRLNEETVEIRRQWLQSVLTRSEQIEGVNVFFFSWSEKPDLLSQSRGYCHPGDGFALGLSGLKLAEVAALAGWALAPCVYDEALQTELLTGILDDELESFVSGSGDVDSRRAESSQALVSNLLRVAPILKNTAFAEEREWRFISPLVEVGSKGFDFRPGPSSLVPFFHFPLPDEVFDGCRLVIGPTSDEHLSRAATSSLLVQKGVRFESVANSRVPLRNW